MITGPRDPDPHAAAGRHPLRAAALDILQAVVVVLAVVSLGIWFMRRTELHLREITAMVDEIRGDLKDHRRYIAERDAAWAREIGLPLPPHGPASVGTPNP